MFKRIDHVEIVCPDAEKTIKFYTDVFGFSIVERMEIDAPPLQEVIFLKLGDTMLELLAVKDPEARKSEWQAGYHLMALEVDDMDAALEYLKSKGVETIWGPVAFGPSKRAEVKDINGVSIELRQW